MLCYAASSIQQFVASRTSALCFILDRGLRPSRSSGRVETSAAQHLLRRTGGDQSKRDQTTPSKTTISLVAIGARGRVRKDAVHQGHGQHLVFPRLQIPHELELVDRAPNHDDGPPAAEFPDVGILLVSVCGSNLKQGKARQPGAEQQLCVKPSHRTEVQNARVILVHSTKSLDPRTQTKLTHPSTRRLEQGGRDPFLSSGIHSTNISIYWGGQRGTVAGCFWGVAHVPILM